MKNVFINTTETYYPCVVNVINGKYGEFCKINGSNYSKKEMVAKGYELKALSQAEIIEINSQNAELRKEKNRIAQENFIKTLTEISFTFQNGNKIESVSDFKNNSENIGQKTQGSDAHENLVLIDGDKFFARKHWSNDGIGIWVATEINDAKLNNIGMGRYIGDIYFINEKVYLKKSHD